MFCSFFGGIDCGALGSKTEKQLNQQKTKFALNCNFEKAIRRSH